MASHPKSVLPPSLADRLSALRLSQDATSEEIAAILKEVAAIPAELVGRAGEEIAKSAGLGWWRTPPVQVVPAKTVFDWFARKRGRPPQPPAPSSEWDLLKADAGYAWIFLFHPDGYLREAALHAIRTLPPAPFFSAALAVRLNDWVPQVRLAARQCFARIAPQIQAHVVANAAFYLLPQRFTWQRWRDGASVLDEVFTRDDVLAALADELAMRPSGSVRTCFCQALRFSNFDRHLPRLAAKAAQPSVRAIAYQSLISGKVSWPVGFEWIWIDKVYNRRRRIPTLDSRDIERTAALDDILSAGVGDKSAYVRKVVADAMIAVRSEVADESSLVATLAADRNPAVRERADFMSRHPVQRQAT